MTTELPSIAIDYVGFMDTLQRHGWRPRQALGGGDGYQVHLYHESRKEPDGMPQRASVIVSQEVHDDTDWLHASIYLGEDVTPTYDDMVMLHRAVFGRRRHAWQCFVPGDEHVNIKNALHLWGRVDGRNALPDFGRHGTI
jgi:hypothetical protein